MKELLLPVQADLRAYLSLPLASEHLPLSPPLHAHLCPSTEGRVPYRQQMGDTALSTILVVGDNRSPSHLLRDNNNLSYRPSLLYQVDQWVVQAVGQKKNLLLLLVTEVILHHSSQIRPYLVVDLYDQVREFHLQQKPCLIKEHRVHQYEALLVFQIDHNHLQGG